MSDKEIFVTYSWDNEEHNEKVFSFTNFLRDKGFNAEVDRMLMQKESSIDFLKMMHRGMTDYKKVIVILSKGYKIKAETFKGGVGDEYNLILKDFDSNPNKFILVTFDEISDDIIPLFFKRRQIIDLSNNDKGRINELFAKLKDETIYEFSEVSPNKPEVQKKEISEFFTNKDSILIESIVIKSDNSSSSALKYKHIEFTMEMNFKNNTNKILTDYTIDVYYPKNSTDYGLEGRMEGDYKIITYESSSKIYPSQMKNQKLANFSIRNYTINEIIDKYIKIVLYCDFGSFEKTFSIADIEVKVLLGGNAKIDPNLFLDRNSEYW